MGSGDQVASKSIFLQTVHAGMELCAYSRLSFFTGVRTGCVVSAPIVVLPNRVHADGGGRVPSFPIFGSRVTRWTVVEFESGLMGVQIMLVAILMLIASGLGVMAFTLHFGAIATSWLTVKTSRLPCCFSVCAEASRT